MKRLSLFFSIVLAIAIGACGTPLLTTFNDKAAAADKTLQLAQTTSTALLRAKKINVGQDQNVQKQLDLLHESIVLAKTLQASDPAAADAQLTQASGQLAAIQSTQAKQGASK